MALAIVTGAAKGLGRAIAERFSADGFTVIGADIDMVGLRSVASSCGAAFHPFELDVTSQEQWGALQAFAAGLDAPLSVMVNNAGIVVNGTIESLAPETFRNALDVNVTGAFHGCRLAIELMKPHGGSIVNIASRASIRANPDLLAYGTSKAALVMMTKAIALHCAREGHGIRCNAVLPGLFETANNDLVAARLGNVDEVYSNWAKMIPVGRIGQPAEVAALVAFLASSEASFITGAEYTIDGGSSL